MKLFSVTAIAAVLSSATQANARVAVPKAPNDCIEKVQGIWQYVVNSGDKSTDENGRRNAGGYPTVIIIACTEVLEDVKAGIDVNGNPIEWKAGETRCQYSETSANVCSFIGYFRPEQITKIGGQCAWGYKEGDLDSNDAMVVFETQDEGEPGPFCETYANATLPPLKCGGTCYRGKGIVQNNGFNVIRLSEDSGKTVYNNNFPRIGAPYRK